MRIANILPAKSRKDSKQTLQHFRFARIRQVLWATVSALTVGLITNFIFIPRIGPIVSIFLAILALGLAFYALEKKKLNLSIGILLWTLIITISYLILSGDGLRDAAILAFPGILIYTAMLSSDRQFKLIFLLVVLVVIFTGLAEYYQWVTIHSDNLEIAHIIDTTAILLVVGFSVWLLSSDLNRAFRQLGVEIQRVKDSQAQIQYIANYDQLTGLPNRNLSRDRFEQSLARVSRTESSIAVLFLDLDNFKNVNDTLGHDIGDALLTELASRLESTVRKQDTVSRQGGDEFLVILESMPNEEGISRIARNILKRVQEPYEIDGRLVESSASLGISIAPNDGDEFETVRKNADIAMYRAKEDGRNTFRYFNEEMQRQTQEHFELLIDLRESTRTQDFELHFQPKVTLSDNNIIGAEALIRWMHPDRGDVPPDVFIPIAESSGLIESIGEWVIHEACRVCASWHAHGYTDLTIAVNVSFVQFRRSNLKSVIEHAIQETGLDPVFLELELTESLLHDDTYRVSEQIHEINKLGVVFSIDDFGTGYSNLGYLRELDISVLKIDRSFIRDIKDSQHAASLARGIIQLAKSLDLSVIAEGIEDDTTRDKLMMLNCQMGQGYFWSPPVTNDDFVQLLSSRLKV